VGKIVITEFSTDVIMVYMNSFFFFLAVEEILFYFLNFLFIYSHVHILLGPFLSPATTSSLYPLPSLPGRTCSALISNFVEEKT
jgi:acyl-coenzyme A synthetase/AMP-(fatty) acid ligase